MKVLSSHPRLTDRPPRRTENPHKENGKPQPTRYKLTLVLAGITAADYLQWIRDPDPPARPELKLISAQAAPLGNRIELELLARRDPPPHRATATAVGFPITPEVIGIHRRPHRAATHTSSRSLKPRGS
jgi:hypothetical protein